MLASAGCLSSAPSDLHRVRLAGAQIPAELVESWLDRADSPRFRTERVQFFLSVHGFKHLRQGTCDLACTDRPITERELHDFGSPPAGLRAGFYGYALYVHPANTVDSIFGPQLGDIFSRKIRNWKDLGGDDAPMRLFGPRKSSRGGEIITREAEMFVQDPEWEVLRSDAEIVEAVAADPLALGFAEIGHDETVRYLGVRMQRAAEPSFPSRDEIEAGRYPIAKVIYVYYTEPPSPAVVAAIDFLFSDSGRSLLESTRVWPIPRARAVVQTGS